jgi:hypothetical protein
MAQQPSPRYFPADTMKVIDEVTADVGRVLTEARARLEASGVRKGFEQGRICFDHPHNPACGWSAGTRS